MTKDEKAFFELNIPDYGWMDGNLEGYSHLKRTDYKIRMLFDYEFQAYEIVFPLLFTEILIISLLSYALSLIFKIK